MADKILSLPLPLEVFDSIEFKSPLGGGKVTMMLTYADIPALTGFAGQRREYEIDEDVAKVLLRALNQEVFAMRNQHEDKIRTKEELVINPKSYHDALCTCGDSPCINKLYYINRLLYVVDTLRRRICNVELINQNVLRFR